MTHTFDIETEELEMLLEALEAQKKKCKSIAERPIQGYGTATERGKKETWASKAEEWRDLITKISNQTVS